MDGVPFLFCDFVVSTLRALPERSEQLIGSWGAVFESHQTNRRTFDLCIIPYDGDWLYNLVSQPEGDNNPTIEEFLMLPMRFTRIAAISISDGPLALMGFKISDIPIDEIIGSTGFYMNEPTIAFEEAVPEVEDEESELLSLLPYLSDIHFREIHLDIESSVASYEEFLRSQLPRERLRKVTLNNHVEWSALVAEELDKTFPNEAIIEEEEASFKEYTR
ncbi:hypothetical protein QR680_003797 [Steinernema hermaphroditum]|uniref:Uncharacterized protein n=1 Tax=Steinernema hermaphroditum TaxID=289476 RepID=A0AA39HLK6_9BILA|nr:hypothetical protein QR680_003797 [Steinernema hermaphroditum]